ncbi:MAG: TatD family deoxyribonuclease [Armatimonadetes bacterium]|nr:TatD family deoxyribonuclease [Armatimonadota bacterium]
MFDSHCHLNHPEFLADADAAIARAHEAGVIGILVAGCDLEGSEQAVALAEAHPSVWAAVGIHPHEARRYDADAEARLLELAAHPRVVAIGEIGLDYHYDFSPRDRQLEAFRAQLELAEGLGMPVVIHCREAHGDTLAELEAWGERSAAKSCGYTSYGRTGHRVEDARRAGALRGVMHCWSGNVAEARRAVVCGMMIGIAGVITFKKRGDLGEVLRSVPPESLLIETDAPYLAPAPHRGHRNEPAFVGYVCSRVAEDLGASPETIAAITERNARRLFGLPSL